MKRSAPRVNINALTSIVITVTTKAAGSKLLTTARTVDRMRLTSGDWISRDISHAPPSRTFGIDVDHDLLVQRPKKQMKIASFSIALILSLFAFSAIGAGKTYDHKEIGACEAVIGGTSTGLRMRKNAVAEAKAFCSTAGGVSVGKSPDDFVARTEGSGPPSCYVTGRIECVK
jgi:hypothetical protein